MSLHTNYRFQKLLLNILMACVCTLISFQGTSAFAWTLINPAPNLESEPLTRKFALLQNTNGDTLKIYLNNRNEAWLRFDAMQIARFSNTTTIAIEYTVDEKTRRRFIPSTVTSESMISSFFAPKSYSVGSSIEVSLDFSSAEAGLSSALKQIIEGKSIQIKYGNRQGVLTSTFALTGDLNPLYEALNLSEGVSSGRLLYQETYKTLRLAAHTQCQASAIQQDYSDCIKPFEQCKSQNFSLLAEMEKCFKLHLKNAD